MEEQKKVAEERSEEALLARRRADTLACLALGRSLGALAMSKYGSGEPDVALLLGFYAWKFVYGNGGDVYLPEIFNALLLTSGLSGSFFGHKGTIRDITVSENPEEFPALVSVGQQGEVIGWREESGSFLPSLLYAKADMDFRKVVVDGRGKCIYALTYDGKLLVLEDEGYTYAGIVDVHRVGGCGLVVLEQGVRIFFKDGAVVDWNGQLAESVVALRSAGISAVACLGTDSWIGDSKGCVVCVDSRGRISDSLSFGKREAVTALAVDAGGQWMVVGYEDGQVVLVDRCSREYRVFSGHQSAVTGLAFVDGKFVSVSYDRILKSWDVALENKGPVVLATYQGWLYCLGVAKAGIVVCGGTAQVLNACAVFPEKMAEALHGRLKRGFTDEEWNYYIGDGKEEWRDEWN